MTTKTILGEARTKAQQAEATAAAGKRLYELALEKESTDPDTATRLKEESLEMLRNAEADLEVARALNDAVKPAK